MLTTHVANQNRQISNTFMSDLEVKKPLMHHVEHMELQN